MFNSFRLAMTWLHTWFGLVLGFVLMVAFFFGSLSVFDREIDRWSLPDTRIEPQPMPSFDAILATRFATITEPDAVPDSSLPDDTIYGDITIDPRDGRVLPEDR